MPPIPAGLDCLTLAPQTLLEQTPVDRDALAVAAGEEQGGMLERIAISDALDTLSVIRMRALLARMADEDGSRVMSEPSRLTCRRMKPSATNKLSSVEFAAKAIAVREARLEKGAKAAAAEMRRIGGL